MNSGHKCELNWGNFDVVDPVSFHYWDFIVNKWQDWRTISISNPRTKTYVSSTAAFTDERRRHLRMSSFWIIHPFSQIRFVWDTIMIPVYLTSFVTIPLMTTFRVNGPFAVVMDDINLYIYGASWLAIFINCISGVHDEKNVDIVLEQREIIRNYLKGFFLIDAISSLPYDRLTLPWRVLPGPESGIFIPLVNLLPNLKILRFISMRKYNRHLCKYFKVRDLVHQVSNIVILAIFMLHWFACLCYMASTLLLHSQKLAVKDCECWLTKLGSDKPGMHLLYRQCLFMAVTNLARCGYGVIPPRRFGHMMVCIVLMIVGALFVDYLIVLILRLKSQIYMAETKYEEIMNQLKAYMRQKQLPGYMKRRLLSYYYYRFSKSFYREKEISSTLPENLRREIALHSCRRFVQTVALFRNLPRNVLESIVLNLKMELYLQNDVIIKAGTQGDCMFFLASGTVAVLTPTGKEVCHLEDGAHFGEVALLVQDQRRVASVVAIEVCNVFRLDRKDFRRCVAVHTDLFAKIERLATGRMEKTVLLEEQHKRFLLQRSGRRQSGGIRSLRTKSLYSITKQ